MAVLKNGEHAPKFVLKNQQNQDIALDNYLGKKVLLYFYPKADTPGCTKQACGIRDEREKLKEKGIEVLGVSPDKLEKQQKFDDKYTLRFPLLSDPDHKVAEAYGAWGEKKMYGKVYMGIIRSSFLIDENGAIMAAWYKVKPDQTVSKVLELLA